MEGHGRSFPDTRLTFQVRKVIAGLGLEDYSTSPSPFPIGIPWIWDLDLIRDFRTLT